MRGPRFRGVGWLQFEKHGILGKFSEKLFTTISILPITANWGGCGLNGRLELLFGGERCSGVLRDSLHTRNSLVALPFSLFDPVPRRRFHVLAAPQNLDPQIPISPWPWPHRQQNGLLADCSQLNNPFPGRIPQGLFCRRKKMRAIHRVRKTECSGRRAFLGRWAVVGGWDSTSMLYPKRSSLKISILNASTHRFRVTSGPGVRFRSAGMRTIYGSPLLKKF